MNTLLFSSCLSLVLSFSPHPHRFLSTSIADTPSLRSLGFMFRTHIPFNRGIFFVFPSSRFVSFWMKNTPSPLDIGFVSFAGSILSVSFDCSPFSVTPIVSPAPVPFVIEVPSGSARFFGIVPGAHIASFRCLQ